MKRLFGIKKNVSEITNSNDYYIENVRPSKELFSLPIEMLHYILDKLDLPDLVRSRLVSKKFKFLIDSLKKRKLIIFEHENDCNDNYLLQGIGFNMKLDFSNSFLTTSKFSRLLRFTWFKSFLINLKELMLFNTDYSGFGRGPPYHWPDDDSYELKIQTLNEFVNLEKLFLYCFKSKNNEILDHPNIKYFTLLCEADINYRSKENRKITYLPKNKIIIKSKVKELVFITHFNIVELINPDFVTSLTILCSSLVTNFTELLNLKTLRLYHFDREKLNLVTLKSFKNLEEFFIEGYFESEFLNELINLKSDNVIKIKKIYYSNVELLKPIKDKEFENDAKSKWDILKINPRLKFQLLNYILLADDKIHYHHFDINGLFDLVQNDEILFEGLDRHQLIHKLPANFFQKFDNIHTVDVKNLTDEENILNFLRSCKFLMCLYISSPKISQNFLDNLPKICSHSLIILSIESDKKKSKKLNFEFVLELKYIRSLDALDHILEYKFALKLLRNCRWLTRLSYGTSTVPITLSEALIPYLDRDEKQIKKFIDRDTFPFNLPSSKKNKNNKLTYNQLVEFLKKTKGSFFVVTEIKKERPCILHGFFRTYLKKETI